MHHGFVSSFSSSSLMQVHQTQQRLDQICLSCKQIHTPSLCRCLCLLAYFALALGSMRQANEVLLYRVQTPIQRRYLLLTLRKGKEKGGKDKTTGSKCNMQMLERRNRSVCVSALKSFRVMFAFGPSVLAWMLTCLLAYLSCIAFFLSFFSDLIVFCLCFQC